MLSVLTAGCSTKSAAKELQQQDEAGTDGSAARGGTSNDSAGGVDGAGTAGVNGGGASGTNGGSGTGGAADGSDGSVRFDCTEFARVHCGRTMECISTVAIASLYGSLDNCVAALAETCSRQLAAPGAAVPATAQCMSEIAALSCAQFLDGVPASCLFKGSRANRETCVYGSQCQSGFCSRPVQQDCGQCVDPIPLNGECTTTVLCELGTTCRNGRCIAEAQRGEPCSDSQPCILLLNCVDSRCTGGLPLGSPCDAGLSSCEVSEGLQCLPDMSGNATCKQPVIVGLGQRCGWVNGEQAHCRGDAWCDRTTFVCVPKPMEGESCASPQPSPCWVPLECMSGTCRYPEPRTCG